MAAVAFVSSQTSQGAATTTPTLTLPAGVAAGDVLIAELTLFLNASDTTITAASGWTQIASNINGTAIRQALYWKVAAGGDANPVFTLAASKAFSGGVSRWTGVDTIRAFTTGAGTASNNTTPTSPTLTIEQPGATYLHFVGRNSNTVVTTAPTNFTTRYAINNASAQVQSYMASRAFAATTGASGTVQSTGDGGSNYVVQGLLLYSTDYATFRSGAVIGAVTATSIGVTIPAGLALNDIWGVQLFVNSTTVTVTPPVSGGTWNTLTSIVNGTSFKHWLFWKRAVAGEVTNTFTLSASATVSAETFAYRNSPTAGGVFDVVGAGNSGNSTTITELAITPTQTNVTLLGLGLNSGGGANTTTPDASMFERIDNSHHLQDAVLRSPASTGNKTATFSIAATWTGVLAALLSTTSVAGGPSGPPFLMPPRQLFPLIAR